MILDIIRHGQTDYRDVDNMPLFRRTANLQNFTAYTTIHFKMNNERMCIPRILYYENKSHVAGLA